MVRAQREALVERHLPAPALIVVLARRDMKATVALGALVNVSELAGGLGTGHDPAGTVHGRVHRFDGVR